GDARDLDCRAALAMLVVDLTDFSCRQQSGDVIQAMSHVTADAAFDNANRLLRVLRIAQAPHDLGKLFQKRDERYHCFTVLLHVFSVDSIRRDLEPRADDGNLPAANEENAKASN